MILVWFNHHYSERFIYYYYFEMILWTGEDKYLELQLLFSLHVLRKKITEEIKKIYLYILISFFFIHVCRYFPDWFYTYICDERKCPLEKIITNRQNNFKIQQFPKLTTHVIVAIFFIFRYLFIYLIILHWKKKIS